MYDNSRLPSEMNVLVHPYDTQLSRWSLHAANTMTVMSPATLLPSKTTSFSSSASSSSSSSSSFYLPQSQGVKQTNSPNYVNIRPLHSTSSVHHHLSTSQRPKSTMIYDLNSTDQSLAHLNHLRHRYESKGIVGIVKPMIHQRSFNQLNDQHSLSTEKNQMPDPVIDNHHNPPHPSIPHHHSTRSLNPSFSSSPSSISVGTPSSVMYRSRRPPSSHGQLNGPPPVAPRRHSSISNNKYQSSRRSSRTTSTSSSIVPITDLTPSDDEQQQQQPHNEDATILDVKRLEMFYSSVGTMVKSARSIARLYTTSTQQVAGFEDWSCQQRGVPVWVYNTGANLKRARQVRLLLAQYDSCFSIWSTLISNQVEIRLPKDNYITCWLPESNVLVVLKFEREDACRLFYRNYYEILEHERKVNLANPPPLPADNHSIDKSTNHPSTSTSTTKEIPRRYSRLRTLGSKQDKEEKEQQFELRRCRSLSRIRTVKKSAISGPINFEHVNHLSINSHQERTFSNIGGGTLRSLHASMSHLAHHGSIADRSSNIHNKRTSVSFETRTTAV